LSEVHDWNFDKAEAAYRKALQLNPQYATAHQWYGELLFHTGRLDSSVAQIRRAGELDPLAPIIPAALGYALVASGKYDQAVAEIRKGVQLAPTLGIHHFMLGDAYIAAGKYAQAVPELQLAARLDPELALRKGFLAYAYGYTGETAKARSIIADLEERKRKHERSGVALSIAYLGVRENDKALSALEQAVNEHDISLITQSSLVPDKLFDPLRKDPRFDAMLARMNLLQYDRVLHKR
jgi:tetratricopeptide (TPR) repeat protein